MIDPLIPRIIAVGFSLLWLGAAWHKFAARQSFRRVLEDYRLLPAMSVSILALLVPAVEALLAVAWLLALAPAVVSITTSALLAVYATAIAINLLRGRAYIGCGCGFSPGADGPPLSWTLVFRNLLLIAMALVTLLPQAQRSLGPVDYALLVLALLLITLLHSAMTQLLRNRIALGAWSDAHD